MDTTLKAFRDSIKDEIPSARLEIDAPAKPSGIWFVDIHMGKRRVALEYRPRQGFGIFSARAEFGEGPVEVYRTAELAARRVTQILTAKVDGALSLKELRDLYSLTQEDLAKRIGIKQAAVSRFEKRREVKLGTLSDAVEAIGGRLEVRAKFRDADIRLSLKG